MRRHSMVMIVLSASAWAGCVDDNNSIFIEGNVIPQQQEDTCSLTSDSDQLLTSGVYNVDIGGAYRVFPLYNNQLRNRASDTRSDPNGINVRSAEVELRAIDGQPVNFGGLPNPFTVPTSTFVPASSDGTTPMRRVGEIEVIPTAYRDFLVSLAPGTVVVGVRIFGQTNGDISVESADWQWTVDLCRGRCLVSCIAGDDEEMPSCSVGQDFASQLNCDMRGL